MNQSVLTLQRASTLTVPWFLLVFLGAAALRIVGFWTGYPHAWSDEFNFVHRALAVGTGDFAPQDFTRPAFYIYLVCIEYGVFYLIGLLFDWWSSTEEFAMEYLNSTAYLVVLGRALCVVFSLATVLVVYRTGVRHFGQIAGLIAAVWLGVNTGHVAMTQTLNADIASGFFAALGLYFLLNYIDTSKRSDLLKAAMAIGAGAATKYYPIVMLANVFIVVCFTQYRTLPAPLSWTEVLFSTTRRFLLGFLAVIATFFVLTPFNFLHPDGMSLIADEFNAVSNWIHAALTGTEAPARPVELRAKSNHMDGLVHYFRLLFLPNSLGPILATMGCIATIVCLFSRDLRKVTIVIFPLLLISLSIINRPGFSDIRHQVPMFPHLAVAVGVVAAGLLQKSVRWRLPITLVLVGCLAWVAKDTAANSLWKANTDARTLARNWILENIEPDSKILLMNYTVRLLPNANSIEREMDEIATGARLYEAAYPDIEADPYGGLWRYFDYSTKLADKNPAYDLLTLRAPEWRFGDQSPPNTRYYHEPTDLKIGDPYRRYGVEKLAHYKEHTIEIRRID